MKPQPPPRDSILVRSSDDEGGVPARALDAGGGATPPRWTDSRRSFTCSRRLTQVSGLLLAAACLVGSAQAAAKPKPWQWTPKQAAAAIAAVDPLFPSVRELQSLTCSGRGKPAQKRWAAFKCSATVVLRGLDSNPQTKPVWMKVRRVGVGSVCISTVSLAAVPAGCLDPKGKRTNGPATDELRRVLGEKYDSPGGAYQGSLECMPHGSGFYTCVFGGNGTAVVVFRPAGVTVRITAEPAP